MTYQLNFPGKIIFGAGSSEMLPQELPTETTILLVTGRHAQKDGLLDRLKKLLSAHKLIVVSGILSEVPLSEVDKLIDAGRSGQARAVVAVGGGSVIDAAKAAAALIPAEGSVVDYFHGQKKIAAKGLFFAALPTTAGTGAEITPNAVLSELATHTKKSLRHPTMFADLAIVDPELTFSCPPALTAGSGLDALTQAIESYISRNANTVSRVLATKATQLLIDNLETVYNNPANHSARHFMAEGSMLGAMAFTQSGLGAVHGLAHPIGCLLALPHGFCCAVLLPLIMRINQSSCRDALDELACSCKLRDGNTLIEQIEQLQRKLQIPTGFRDHDLTRQHFPFIIEHCRSNSMSNNPTQFSDAEIAEILETLIDHNK